MATQWESALAAIKGKYAPRRAAAAKTAQDTPWRHNVATFAEHISAGRWKPYRHCLFIAELVLTGIKTGGARIIINMPPRHGKSELISKWLPVWALDDDPRRRILMTSYSADLAQDWSWQARQVIADEQALNCGIMPGKAQKSDWGTSHRLTGKSAGGGIRSAGVGGSITGFGGNIQVCDDPIKNWQEARSETHNATVNAWWDTTFITRLEPGGSVVLIMTRWSDRDTTAYLEKKGYEIIRLPAIAEDGDPLGRQPGEALCPERYPLEELLKIKEEVGSFTWEAMYQQRPAALGGNLIKLDWFRYWDAMPSLDQFDVISQFWDFNFKEAGHSFFCGQVWGRIGASYYLLDQIRSKGDYTEARAAVIMMSGKWPDAARKVIEDRANGPAIMADLRKTVDGMVGWPPKGQRFDDKTTRLQGVSPLFEAGNVFLPNPDKHRWVFAYIDELTRFPNAENDDQVDTTSMALADLRDRPRFQVRRISA